MQTKCRSRCVICARIKSMISTSSVWWPKTLRSRRERVNFETLKSGWARWDNPFLIAALGLPLEAVPVPRVIHHIETKPAVVRLFDLKYSVEDNLLIQRALGRNQAKPEDIPSTSTAKKRPSKADTPPQPPPKKSKKDVTCAICTDSHFAYQSDLNELVTMRWVNLQSYKNLLCSHLMKVHLPQVAKYACGSCRETFDQLSDHKAHENWHSKEKLPFTCFNCFAAYARLRDFSK